MFVDCDRDRYGSQRKPIQGIMQNRPIQLLPLCEKLATLRVLLLHDTEQLDAVLTAKFL